MPSANKTPNIGLNQWTGNEYPKRQDFVDDNSMIDTEISNLKKIAHGAVADLAALKAINTTNLADNIIIIVKSLGFYRFDSTSSLTADDNSIIKPTTGPGRWLNEIAALDKKVTSHQADYVRQPGYGADSGTTANTYIVTLNPAPASYVDGMGIAIKIKNTNTGASTVNVSGLGAKTIKNPDGTDVSAGDLTAGGIYSLKYNSATSNFILVGKGGVKLTATAIDSQVLSGQTYYNTDAKTKRTGSMPNNGAINVTQTASGQVTTIPAGYTSGGQVTNNITISSLGGKRTAIGTYTKSSYFTITLPAFGFTPSYLVCWSTTADSTTGPYVIVYDTRKSTTTVLYADQNTNNLFTMPINNGTYYINSSGAYINTKDNGIYNTGCWFAIE